MHVRHAEMFFTFLPSDRMRFQFPQETIAEIPLKCGCIIHKPTNKMVTKKTIKGLDFNTIEEYFGYIFDSITNGQKQQAKKLFSKLSASQKIDLYSFTEQYEYSLIELLDVVNPHK